MTDYAWYTMVRAYVEKEWANPSSRLSGAEPPSASRSRRN
jgi:hypothetical protein